MSLLINRARKIVAPSFVKYYEMVAENPKCINDFIVYEGERSILSITTDLKLIKYLIKLGADINALAFSNYDVTYKYKDFEIPPTNLWYLMSIYNDEILEYFFNTFDIQISSYDECLLFKTAYKKNSSLVRYLKKNDEILKKTLAKITIKIQFNLMQLKDLEYLEFLKYL